MEKLVLSILALAVSLMVLYWGSKRVVRGASGLSSCLNLSRVVVGTVFVASVTALPELLMTAPFMVIATLMLFALNKLSSNVSRLWGVMMLATVGLAFIFQTSYSIV